VLDLSGKHGKGARAIFKLTPGQRRKQSRDRFPSQKISTLTTESNFDHAWKLRRPWMLLQVLLPSLRRLPGQRVRGEKARNIQHRNRALAFCSNLLFFFLTVPGHAFGLLPWMLVHHVVLGTYSRCACRRCPFGRADEALGSFWFVTGIPESVVTIEAKFR